MSTFFRVLDAAVDEKASALLAAVHEGRQEFNVDWRDLRMIPGSTFAYWAPRTVLQLFRNCESFEASGRIARVTNPAGDDGRNFRLWFEVPSTSAGRHWVPMAKGGAFGRYYSEIPLVCDWDEARRTFRGFTGTPHRPIERLASDEFFFRSGLTYSTRSQKGFSVRVLPAGCVFHAKGPGVFVPPSEEPLAYLAILNSQAFRFLLSLQIGFGSYEVGAVQRTPVPAIGTTQCEKLVTLAKEAWAIRYADCQYDETSRGFIGPRLMLGQRSHAIQRDRLLEIDQLINSIVFDLYGLGAQDRKAIEEHFGEGFQQESGSSDVSDDEDEADSGGEESFPDGIDAETSVLSWLVGVAFGRFDLRLATGERPLPPGPEPFDPLPARSPGMWPAGEMRPVAPPDIAVDDPGHPHDLAAIASAVAENIAMPVLEPAKLRQWLAREFFALHVRMYTKSRRKAPIYWQVATRSAKYSVWLYVHSLSADTMFRVLNEYVMPKLRLEEQRLAQARADEGERASATQRRAIADQENFVNELRDLLDEVRRVAPLWNPSLDDGVIVNFALLWRLVPHQKPWQKELKSAWDALCNGKHDWAHLAMRLWPERVVPKCAKDRSLAIAHDLEHVFWERSHDGKWYPRRRPVLGVEELIAERTSSAVKAALNELLNAPTIAGHGAGRRLVTGNSRGGR